MNIEKIDVKKINIITVVNDRFTKSTEEMLLEQQLFFANKINEIIDVLNEKENSEEEKTITISTSEEQCEYCEYCGCGRMGNIFIHDLKKETTTPWIPKEVDNYYYIYNINGFNNKLTIGKDCWDGNKIDIYRFKSGNCFRTYEEAKNKLNEELEKMKDK